MGYQCSYSIIDIHRIIPTTNSLNKWGPECCSDDHGLSLRCTNIYAYIHTIWLFNIAMEAMAHRNRWFTY